MYHQFEPDLGCDQEADKSDGTGLDSVREHLTAPGHSPLFGLRSEGNTDQKAFPCVCAPRRTTRCLDIPPYPATLVTLRRCAFALGFLLVASIPASAAAGPVASAMVASGDSTRLKSAAMHTRFYVGMWSTHLRDIDRGLGANWLIGVSYRGFFAATFINSFGDRSLSIGLQRSFSSPRAGHVTTAFGYRIGIITGYDERFFGIGDKLPAIPFAQFVAAVDVRNVGLEVTYSGIVASVGLNWRL